MFIRKVANNDGGDCDPPIDDTAHNLATSDQLIDFISKNQNLNSYDGGDALTQSELVLLYKNLDNSINSLSSSKRRANQRVETIKHNDIIDSDASDSLSEISYSYEDLRNIYLINNKKIDLLNDSIDNLLCHKYGNVDMNSSPNAFNRRNLYTDCAGTSGTIDRLVNEKEVITTSLDDYVGCKKLEDNYTFYMDNIILYVKNTMEQLKRISNGDYLTNRAQAKWREVALHDSTDSVLERKSSTQILANSTSIPLHVECKIGGEQSKWDDIVHSDVDVRSLTKILEKKIVVEIPKLVLGSYVISSKLCADNLFISCIHEKPQVSKKKSRVDVVFQMQRSESGHVESNVNSIMILKSHRPRQRNLKDLPLPPPLTYTSESCKNNIELSEINAEPDKKIDVQESLQCHDHYHTSRNPFQISINDKNMTPNIKNNEMATTIDEVNKISEFNDEVRENDDHNDAINDNLDNDDEINDNLDNVDEINDNLDNGDDEINNNLDNDAEINDNLDNDDVINDNLDHKNEIKNNIAHNDDNEKMVPKCHEDASVLCTSAMTKSQGAIKNAQECLLEPTDETCASDIDFNEYTEQFWTDSLRVTMNNLSIQSAVQEETTDIAVIEDLTLTMKSSEPIVRIKSPYENKSHAIDEKKRKRLLEIRSRREKNKIAMAAEVSKSSKTKNGFGSMAQPNCSVTKLSIGNKAFYDSIYGQNANNDPLKQPKKMAGKEIIKKYVMTHEKPKEKPQEVTEAKEAKSIKSYISKSYCLDDPVSEMMYLDEKEKAKSSPFSGLGTGDFEKILQAIDSCETNLNLDMGNKNVTSVTINGASKPQSNIKLRHETNKKPPIPVFSLFSTTKPTIVNKNKINAMENKSSRPVTTLECRKSIDKLYKLVKDLGKQNSVQSSNKLYIPPYHPKVAPLPASGTRIMSPRDYDNKTKANGPSLNISPQTSSRNRRDKRRLSNSSTGKPQLALPLSKLTRLLEEFDNVKRDLINPSPKQKRVSSINTGGNAVISNEHRTVTSPINRTTRPEEYKDLNKGSKTITKDKKQKSPNLQPIDVTKISYQQNLINVNYGLNNIKKQKLKDVLDEEKEARGEAVRGPSKFSSRLQSLSQPKKTYVQANSAECQSRYGRNSVITDRLQKLAATPTLPVADRSSIMSPKRKPKRNDRVGFPPNCTQPSTNKTSPMSSWIPLDKPTKPRYNIINSKTEVIEKKSSMGKTVETPVLTTYMLESSQLTEESMVESYEKDFFEKQEILDPYLPFNKELLKPISITSLLRNNLDIASYTSEEGPTKSSRSLEVLKECKENSSSSSFNENFTPLENILRFCELFSDSALEISEETENNSDNPKYNVTKVISNDEIAIEDYGEHDYKIAGNLCHSSFMGNFCKRLEINQGPSKRSRQGVFVLGSSCSNSVIVNADQLLPILSKSCWSVIPIPMQINTVGYVSASGGKHSSLISIQSSENICEKANTYSSTSLLHKLNDRHKTRSNEANQDNASSTREPLIEVTANQHSENNIVLNQIACDEPIINDDYPSIIIEKEDDDEISKMHSEIMSNKDELIDCTASLDVLVRLLKEIKKITSCQARITKIDNQPDLEMILDNKHYFLNNSVQSKGSFTSVEKSKSMASDQSLRSIFVTNGNDVKNKSNITFQQNITHWSNIKHDSYFDPCHIDREMNTSTEDKQLRDAITDIPSFSFPLTVKHSINRYNSATDICQTSKSLNSQSSSLELKYSDALSVTRTEMPQIEYWKQSVACCVGNQVVTQLNRHRRRLNIKKIPKKVISQQNLCCLKQSNFDPVTKMKRDILVTMYSMLVLTVFAALSLPEVLYYV